MRLFGELMLAPQALFRHKSLLSESRRDAKVGPLPWSLTPRYTDPPLSTNPTAISGVQPEHRATAPGRSAAPPFVSMSDNLYAQELLPILNRELAGRYAAERPLGGGGMSEVFLATDLELHRPVVIKVLSRELTENDSLERFRREIGLAAALQHPLIVPVLSAGEVAHLPYYVMPFVEGESLRGRLDRGPLSIRETVSMLLDVSRALAFAHERGVVHRDIKPGNILLTRESAVLTDLGIAKALAGVKTRAVEQVTSRSGGDITVAGISLGTPAYMAPEQVVGDPNADHRVDLYAIGIVGYEALLGAPPFTGMSAHQLRSAHLTTAPAAITPRRAEVPHALEAILLRCLAKDAAERPQKATELVRLLQSPALFERRKNGLQRAVGRFAEFLRRA